MAEAVAFVRLLPRWTQTVALACAGGLLLGLLGPFGSYLNDDPVIRILYWVASMCSGVPLYGLAISVSARAIAAGRPAFWAALVGSVLVASFPQAILTRSLAFQLWPELANLGLSFGTWYLQVTTVASIVVLGWVTMLGLPSCPRTSIEASLASPKDRPAVLFGRHVLALQMEDHYVRIHSENGSELVLMPLGQAIEAMLSVDGLRTHRSWWVARHALERVEGTPRSMSLHLTNGLVAPVSRNAVAVLRSAGWLEAGCSKPAN